MARVVKGRSPYRQGGDRYEAFRPERRDIERAKTSSSTKELLRVMALAEKIGKSPLGGLAIEGVKGISNMLRETPPTLQEAAAARAAAVPTPEEQGRATGEAQAEEFIQEALKEPAQRMRPLAPAIAEAGPGRMTVRRAPTLEQEDFARKAQEDLARERELEKLRKRREKITSEMEVKKALLKRMEKLAPKFRTRLNVLLKKSPVDVETYLAAVRDKHAGLPGGVKPEEEEFYDVMADYLRIMKGVEVEDIDAAVARVAREAIKDERPSEMDVMPDRMPPEEPEAGMTPEQMRQQRAAEAERSRQAAVEDLREEALPPAEEPAVVETVGLSRERLNSIVDNILGATKAAVTEAEKAQTEIPALEAAEEAQAETIRAAEEAEKVAEAPVEVEDEFMERARAGEKSLQSQREELKNVVMKVAGPAAKPEQVQNFTELLARARTATTGEEQAELIRQTDNVSLPARSIFDAMFGGPQQRARAELIKFFPRTTRARPRTASQIAADEALAEQRRAQAARTRQLTKLYDPERVSKSKAQTKKLLEAAEAREQGYSITESRILKNLRKPIRRGRRGRSQKTDIRASGAAERREVESRFKTEDAPLKAQVTKLENERSILSRQQVGTVPDPGEAPKLPKRPTRSQRKAHATALQKWQGRKDKHEADKTKKEQRDERLGIKGKDGKYPEGSVRWQIERLNKARQDAMRRKNETIRLINNKVAELTGGKTQALRRGAETRAKAQQKKK